MAFGESLYTYLKTQSALTALVNYRIYPVILPQKCKLPALTYEMINRFPVHVMGSDSGPEHVIYRIHCFDETYDNVNDVADQVIAALEDYTGAMGSNTVQRCFYEDRTDQYESQVLTPHIILEFEIWYT